MPEKNIVLIGFMGTGKSSVGRALSREMGIPVLDSDRLIEEMEGMTINEIFARKGQPYFRDAETRLLRNLADRTDRYILSCGGGMPLREENRPLMRALGTVILLDSSVPVLTRRLSRATDRPNLRGEGSLESRIGALLSERMPMYLDAADLIVKNERKSIGQLTAEIRNRLN
jgi:shikimate kinase